VRSPRDELEEILEELNPGALYMDGFDGAIVGYGQIATGEPLAVYDEDMIIEILVNEGLSEEEALDHYGFNIQGAYVGPGTPIILKRLHE